MKKNDVLNKYRQMNLDDCNNLLDKYNEQLFRMKIKNKVGQLSNTASINMHRKDIARIKTILSENLVN